MFPTQRLFELAEEAGITVEWFRFAPPLLGLYFHEPGLCPVIGLDKHLDRNEPLLRCILAEELGHHFTSSGDGVVTPYRTYLGRIMLTRSEKRALAWAARLLMPPEAVVACRAESVWDLADSFGVTCSFVRAAMTLPQYLLIQGRVFVAARTAC